MNFYVIIHDLAQISFYSDDAVRDLLPDIAHKRLLSVPPISGVLEVGGGSENANASINLDNADGLISSLFVNDPILKQCSIHNDSEELFRGVIQSVSLGIAANIVVEA